MMNDTVPVNLGQDHVSLESIVDHQPQTFSKKFFTDLISDTVILVLDETYINTRMNPFCKISTL